MTTFTFVPLKSQYEKIALKLTNGIYENRTQSTAEWAGNYWAAQCAGLMFDKWQFMSDVAAHHNYENDEANTNADEAWAEFEAFRQAFNDAHGRNGKRLVAIGDENGVAEFDPMLAVNGPEDVM